LPSGLLTCGAPTGKAGEACGAHFVKADCYRYACASHLNRQTCQNDLRVPQRASEARLLEGIKRDLFCKEGLALFINETTRLLAERNRQGRSDLGRMQRRRAEVEQEIVKIMTAIKQGVLTVSTKAEREKVEPEKVRLNAHIKGSMAKVGKVTTMLPRAQKRYQALWENLGTAVPKQQIVQSREQTRALAGEIKLVSMTDGS